MQKLSVKHFMWFFVLFLPIASNVSAQTYCEKGGIVVIEAESWPAVEGWTERDTIAGFTGDSFIEWTGPNSFRKSGVGTRSYQIEVTKTGTYRVQWRSRIAFGNDHTEHNDNWLKITGISAEEFYAKKGETILYPHGSGLKPNTKGGENSDGWFKVYMNTLNTWSWDTKTNDNNSYPIFVDFDDPGIYTVQVSGRSMGHAIDRIVLYHTTVASATALNINNPETLCDADRDPKVVSLTLVDADTDQDIQTLKDDDVIVLDELSSRNLNIRANTSQLTIGSVVFGYDDNAAFATESQAPYALAGDQSRDYRNWTPAVGNHTITATPYAESSGQGQAYKPHTVSFVVVESRDDLLEVPENPGTGEVILSGELKKWHKVTLSIDGPTYNETDNLPNPNLDLRLNVTFTNGSKSYTVPGYFAADGDASETSAESGNVWRVHFSPDLEGVWSYECSFRIGHQIAVSDDSSAGKAILPIDGKTGSFQVLPNDKQLPDLRAQGRLEYVGEHYLRFAETGNYFLKGGPDSPENFLAYEDFDNTTDVGGRMKSWAPHAGDYQNGDPSWQNGKGTEIIGVINYLASEGLNVFSFIPMNIEGDDKNVFPYVSKTDFAHFDVSKLDQWSIVFDHAQTKGMYLHFKTQETENELLLDGGAVGVNRKLYYRMLIARFGYHLALNWNLGEENNNQTDQQRKDMAQYFYDHDPYKHHIVIHTYPAEIDKIYNPLVGNKSKLTGPSIQTNWKSVHTQTLNWVQKSAANNKKWVVANDEQGPHGIGVPEDEYTATPNKHDIRKQTLWGNLMAGGAGVEYYFGYKRPHSDLNCEDYRSRDETWDYVRYALHFFKEYVPFWTMNASDDLVDNGWCFAKEGEVYVVYIANGGPSQIEIKQDGEYNIQWYNPRNGGSLADGSKKSIKGIGMHALGNPPADGDQDWVVLITNTKIITYAG